MQEVIGVKFNNSQKIYFFNPIGIEFVEGDGVIVETVRGIEYGIIATSNHEVSESEIKSPLKDVMRKATVGDTKQNQDNLSKRDWAHKVCLEKVQYHKIQLKLVGTEIAFDKSKCIYSFTAESRVDFRELVRDLAGAVKMRIEMKQIYERDDIKMRGALSPCGRVCCCHSHLADFEKVSIKMAKNQNLSLNPQKISGMCGKLMCCLKFENEHYVNTAKLMPKLGSTIKTPLGIARVEYNDLLGLKVKAKVELDDGSYAYKSFELAEIELLPDNRPANNAAPEARPKDKDNRNKANQGIERTAKPTREAQPVQAPSEATAITSDKSTDTPTPDEATVSTDE